MAKMQGLYRSEQKSETKRNHFRARVDIDGYYRLGGEWIPCKIYDISLGGAGLKINQFFVEGDKIELKIGQTEEAVKVTATVVNVNGQRIGISFNLQDEARSKLDRLIGKASAQGKPGKHVRFEI